MGFFIIFKTLSPTCQAKNLNYKTMAITDKKNWFRYYIAVPGLFILGLLWVIILFFIGWIDRFILALAPWTPVHPQTRGAFYDLYAYYSLFRVLGVATIIGIIYLIKYWIV